MAFIVGHGASGLYLGPVAPLRLGPSGVHRLYASLWGVLELYRGDRWTRLSPGHVAFVEAGAAHHLRGTGEAVCVVLDAGGLEPGVLRARTATALAEAPLACWLERPPGGPVRARFLPLLERLAFAGPVDGRLGRALAVVQRAPQDPEVLGRAADAAGWSSSRLRHVARSRTGVSLKRLRLWAKLGKAMTLARAGARLTDAALDGGFSSSAHFSAAHTALLGLSPSRLGEFLSELSVGDRPNLPSATSAVPLRIRAPDIPVTREAA